MWKTAGEQSFNQYTSIIYQSKPITIPWFLFPWCLSQDSVKQNEIYIWIHQRMLCLTSLEFNPRCFSFIFGLMTHGTLLPGNMINNQADWFLPELHHKMLSLNWQWCYDDVFFLSVIKSIKTSCLQSKKWWLNPDTQLLIVSE